MNAMAQNLHFSPFNAYTFSGFSTFLKREKCSFFLEFIFYSFLLEALICTVSNTMHSCNPGTNNEPAAMTFSKFKSRLSKAQEGRRVYLFNIYLSERDQ